MWKYDLLLIVSTAPQRFDRRDAIRKTWWRLCELSEKVRKIHLELFFLKIKNQTFTGARPQL